MCPDVPVSPPPSASLFPPTSKAIHVVALLYALYTAVVFNLPSSFPITRDNFNYSPIGVGVVVFIFVTWWLVDAHRWFKGPKGAWEGEGGVEGESECSVRSGEVVGMGRIFR